MPRKYEVITGLVALYCMWRFRSFLAMTNATTNTVLGAAKGDFTDTTATSTRNKTSHSSSHSTKQIALVRASAEYGNFNNDTQHKQQKTSYVTANYTQVYEKARDYHNLMEQQIPSLNSTQYLPCRFHPKMTQFLQHFPHAMQQLYMCFDVWIEGGILLPQQQEEGHKTSTLIPILLYDNTTQQKLWTMGVNRAPFLGGVVDLLTTQIGLQQASLQDFLQQEPYYQNTTIPSFSQPVGFLFRHADELNDLMQRYLESGQEMEQTDDEDEACPVPQIRILSRLNNRAISNAQEIANRLNTLDFRQGGAADKSAAATILSWLTQQTRSPFRNVTVHFFEGATFLEQVQFFRTTDILISGHGAQLTGLPFLGAERKRSHQRISTCAQLMELFPKNYAIPYYFGSLAVQAGVAHSYMYLAEDGVKKNNNTEYSIVFPWENRVGSKFEERVRARSANLRPSVDVMVDAVGELVRDWRDCWCGHAG